MSAGPAPSWRFAARGLKLSRYVVASDAVFDAAAQKQRRAILGTRRAVPLAVDETAWTALSEERFDLLSPELLDRLAQEEIVVDAGEDELKAVLEGNRAAIAAD